MAVHLLERGTRISPRREARGLLSQLRHIDVVLIATAVVLSVIGFVMVYSASRSEAVAAGDSPSYFVKRQIAYAVLGFVVMVICIAIDYRRLESWAYPIYGAIVLSLVVVIAIGHSQDGAQRWISVGPLTIQPSEFGVLALIVVFATYAAHHEGDLTPRRLVVLLGAAALPMLLVYKQPDLGTTVVLIVVFCSLCFFAGVRLFYLGLGLLVSVGVVLLGLKVGLLHGYQLERLSCFLHQNSSPQSSCYELSVAKTAIGAGGLRGVGLFNGAVTNLGYVPIQYADFIFSAVGEQLGFVGVAAVIGLFGLLALRMFRAAQLARDTLGRLICLGALAFLAFSVFQNIGMNIGLMPITGIPLPFISYGGSALLAFYAAIGLVVNVELRRHSMR